MRIGIIGAGAAGLAALRHSLALGHECVAFEKTDKIGGTWNFTRLTNKDDYGLPVHSSMYLGLKTNLPKEVMEYEDFHYDEKIKDSFISQPEVLDYINKFAKHFDLIPHIRFLRHVLEVDPLPDNKWSLKERNLKTKEITEHNFDAIMVCVGNYSVPKMPTIPGMVDLGDRAIHSHHFREAKVYAGKRVLVIGAGPSGVDIGKLVGEVAEKVYLSYSSMFQQIRGNLEHKPLVKRFEKNKAIFEDGTEVEVDNVIYCTGYTFTYPFLTPACKIEVEHNWVKYLYKHVINVERPTMAFIDVTFRVCPFPTMDLQIRFFLEFLKNYLTKITKDQMMTDVMNDVNERIAQNFKINHKHKIGWEIQQEYFDDLANTVKIRNIKPVICKLYKHVGNTRNLTERYKIITDEEYIILPVD